jgi:phosphate transport system protein
MSRHFQRDLESLQADILAMAAAVQAAVHGAIRALRTKDAALARQVIAGDAEIDRQENQVEEECLKLLALYQPVASDLRRITAILKINTDLERMADLAVDIAQRALHLGELAPIPFPERLQAMADVTAGMVRQSLEAFVAADAHKARLVWRRDDEVDGWNAEVIGELLAAMRACPEQIEPALSLFSAVRHLERVADHATNIAEEVIYLVEGQIVRHHPDAIEEGGPRPPDE